MTLRTLWAGSGVSGQKDIFASIAAEAEEVACQESLPGRRRPLAKKVSLDDARLLSPDFVTIVGWSYLEGA